MRRHAQDGSSENPGTQARYMGDHRVHPAQKAVVGAGCPSSPLCACGCGERTRGGIFKRGHQARRPERRQALASANVARYGRWSNPTLSAINAAKIGEKNPSWRGDDVGYVGLHLWIRKYKQKTGRCSRCRREGYTEWANVSGEYKRDLDDFIELCKPCHEDYDHRREE